MNKLTSLVLLLGLSLAVPVALAHEGAGRPKKDAAARKEQKPWGIAGDARQAKRTVEIRMTDAMRFAPDSVQVKEGETIRFVVRNAGKLMHEMVIGTKETLAEHAALMMKFPNMEHDEPYMAHVAAGKAGELVWHFNRAGDFDFACLVPGHYQAGMTGTIRVTPRKKAP